VTLAGLILRRRVHLCWSFAALLVVTLIGNQLQVHVPGILTRTFWLTKETIYAGLYCAVVVELAWLIFLGLPRAQRPLLAAMTIVIAAAGMLVSSADVESTSVVRVVIAALNGAAAWLAAILVAAVLYWRVPLHPFHRLLLFGLGFHLSFYSMLLGPIAAGWDAMRAYVNALDRIVYIATVGLWLWAAWRPAPAQALTPATAALLQPWAVRP